MILSSTIEEIYKSMTIGLKSDLLACFGLCKTLTLKISHVGISQSMVRLPKKSAKSQGMYTMQLVIKMHLQMTK